MKHAFKAAVAAVGLFAAVPAIAQTSSTTVTTTPGAATTGSVTIAPEQRTKIREYVVKQKRESVEAPSGFTVTTGATVPQSVELYSFGPEVGVSQYRYTVIGDRTVLVDPGTRRVVQVIE